MIALEFLSVGDEENRVRRDGGNAGENEGCSSINYICVVIWVCVVVETESIKCDGRIRVQAESESWDRE